MGLRVVAKKPMAIKAKKAKPKKKKDVAISSIPIGEDNWQAESDARSLMQAEEIKRNPSRLRKAKAIAKKQAVDAMQVAKI